MGVYISNDDHLFNIKLLHVLIIPPSSLINKTKHKTMTQINLYSFSFFDDALRAAPIVPIQRSQGFAGRGGNFIDMRISITLGSICSLGSLLSFGWVRSLFVFLTSPFIFPIDLILKTLVLLRDIGYINFLADFLKLLTVSYILKGFRLAYRFLHDNLVEINDIGLFRKQTVETLIVTLQGIVGPVDCLNANFFLLADVPRLDDRHPLLLDEIVPKTFPNG
jgi:hypothetical protein